MIAGATTLRLDTTTPSTGRASGHEVAGIARQWRAVASRLGLSKASPHAKQIPNRPRPHRLAMAAFRLIQRVFIAEATLWLTALVCALAGLPAIVTAFCVALVAFIVNCWLAVRTLGPVCRKLWKGERA